MGCTKWYNREQSVKIFEYILGLAAVLMFLLQNEHTFTSICIHVCVCVFWHLLVTAKFQLQAASKNCITDAGLQVTKQTSSALNPPVPLKSNLAHKSSDTDKSFRFLYYPLAHSKTESWSAYNNLLPNILQFIKCQSFYHQ
jgi:hypothetical protein